MALDTTAFLAEMTKRLSLIRDRQMRRIKFVQTLARLEDEDACTAIDAIYLDGVLHRKPGVLLLDNLAYLDSLNQILGKERMQRMYYTSLRLGLKFAHEVLSPPPLSEDLHPLEGHKDLAKLTLGEKRALAKKPDLVIIEKLMYDPEPMVIETLLNNPRLLLKHVMFIATRRPNRPEILERVFLHHKWSKIYEVRKALAANPFTPPGIVLVVVPLLNSQDLEVLEYGDNLSASLVAAVLATRNEILGKPPRKREDLIDKQSLEKIANQLIEENLDKLGMSSEDLESPTLEN